MSGTEGKLVLVVDDEEDIRDYFAIVLEDAGFEVMTAADGNEALDQVRKRVPDFISLDLVMPNRSGLKFLHELRKRREWSTIPFVIVTAHASDHPGKRDLQEILSDKTFSGPGVYLEKPVTSERYLEFICQQIGVDCPTAAGGKPHVSAEKLKRDLAKLVDGVDEDQLQEAVRALLRKKDR